MVTKKPIKIPSSKHTNSSTNVNTNTNQPSVVINAINISLHIILIHSPAIILAHSAFENKFYENIIYIIDVFNIIKSILKIVILLFINDIINGLLFFVHKLKVK